MPQEWLGPHRPADILSSNFELLPQEPGVYVWRRTLLRSDSALSSSEDLLQWINEGLTAPFMSGGRLQLKELDGSKREFRAGFVMFERLTIGGGKLTDAKEAGFKSFGADLSSRAALQDLLLTSADLFSPVLYVGEAGDLRDRVRKHLSSGSALMSRLSELTLAADHLLLQALPMPEASKEQRQFIEQILTHVLIAPLSLRPG